MTTSVDVLARRIFEEYSRAGGNQPDAHFDRNAAEQWMAHALEFAGVAELIEAASDICYEVSDRSEGKRLLVEALARVKGA